LILAQIAGKENHKKNTESEVLDDGELTRAEKYQGNTNDRNDKRILKTSCGKEKSFSQMHFYCRDANKNKQ